MQLQWNVGLNCSIIVQQQETDHIAQVGACEPVVVQFFVITDHECLIVDALKDVGCQVRAKGKRFFSAKRILGKSRPDAGAPTHNPAIREINDDVLIGGVGRVVEFSGVDGLRHHRLKIVQSDIPDGKMGL